MRCRLSLREGRESCGPLDEPGGGDSSTPRGERQAVLPASRYSAVCYDDGGGSSDPAGAYLPAPTTDALSIRIGSTGTLAIMPWRLVRTATIASTTSMPSTTLPNTA